MTKLSDTEQASTNELLGMKLNSMAPIGENVMIIRVLGGWIYKFDAGISVAAVYVPEPKEES